MWSRLPFWTRVKWPLGGSCFGFLCFTRCQVITDILRPTNIEETRESISRKHAVNILFLKGQKENPGIFDWWSKVSNSTVFCSLQLAESRWRKSIGFLVAITFTRSKLGLGQFSGGFQRRVPEGGGAVGDITRPNLLG